MKSDEQLKQELSSFQGLWKGGTTLARLGWKHSVANSVYLDYNSILNKCIKPYVDKSAVVLEIGSGGGGWTQHLLGAKEVICFDALSAKHNLFWEHIGNRNNVRYYKVDDFSCGVLVDDSIDYVFSYDVFCHISYSGTRAYLKNLFPKLRSGAHCFIMIADADKYIDKNARRKQLKVAGFKTFDEVVADYDGISKDGGRWFFFGLDRFCDSLNEFGYDIVNKDVGFDKLSPIVHFIRK